MTIDDLEKWQGIFESLRRENHRHGNHDGQRAMEFALEQIRCVQSKSEEKITKHARIGGTEFSPGIAVQTVIDRAYREYDYQNAPEREADRKRIADNQPRWVVKADVPHLWYGGYWFVKRSHMRKALPSASELLSEGLHHCGCSFDAKGSIVDECGYHLRARVHAIETALKVRGPGYMGDVNGPGCDPDVP